MSTLNKSRYLVSLDAGGTMTDTCLTDTQGRSYVGKALTNTADEAGSFAESVADAAMVADVDVADVYAGSELIVYGGTGMLNTVATRTGRNIGLITTRGFEETAYLDRGLVFLGQTRTELYNWQLHEHTESTSPLIDFANIRGVSERILGGNRYGDSHLAAGSTVIPLSEVETHRAVGELLDADVEVIGIMFLCAYANPVHEARAKEIAEALIAQRGLKIPVIASTDICSKKRENTRLKSLLVECYAASKTKEQFLRVEQRARENGYRHDLHTLLSYGAVANIRYPRTYESIISGPAGGLLGGKLLSDLKGWNNVICADLGGTTLDVGILVDGLLPLQKETDFHHHRLNLSSVMLDSLGNGLGSEIHVDGDAKQVSLGPRSAGPRVGMCFKHDEITVSDIDVALGYLSPDNFLGGKVHLDKKRAEDALNARLAKPLGMDLYEACASVLEMMHDSLIDHVSGTLLSRGLSLADYMLLVYGGSGPCHMWGLAERLREAAGICTVPWAAAFSAYGISAAESFYRLEQSVACILANELDDEQRLGEGKKVESAWTELRTEAIAQLALGGYDAGDIRFRYGISARYIGQLWLSWDAHVAHSAVNSTADVDAMIASFENEYARVYPSAGKFLGLGHQIDSVFVEALVPKLQPTLLQHPLSAPKPRESARKGQRAAYWKGEWLSFDVWDMDRLDAGNHVTGPAVLEHPMTTLVIPPERRIELDEHKVMFYRFD